ncbi:YybH family protein [Gaetbulibacter saemankumensis]|uniref:YybH family protein n=1 Tax=Gaetbulibacter saemankumensis TaxID=311208 RepID=UPI000486F70D|nr:nuclear transport factor 2 family protein [Gaetbulibacter saemankumensis]
MKKFILYIFLFGTFTVFSQNSSQKDKKAILAVLNNQSTAWSNNDIEAFMSGYWKHDSLKFYGSNGVTYGWKNTLERYKKTYPDKNHTGKLNFKVNAISKINKGAYYVLGEYHLQRKVGNASGFFMVIFKRIHGEWKIIADTSA